MMTYGDRVGRIFLSHPHTNNGSLFLLNTLRYDMVTSFYHFNDVTERRAAIMRPTCGCSFFFYLILGLVRVITIELYHMGKNNGNPDLVCKYINVIEQVRRL